MNDLPIILGIVFISTVVQATFSFGGALIALPLLAFAVEIKTATPLMTLLSTSIAIVIVLNNRRDIQFRNAWRLILSACIGIPLGILFLSQVAGTILKTVLAITVIGFTLLNLLKIQSVQLVNENYAYVFGFVSGIFGGAYNISGPPVVLYGSLAQWTPAVFRATIQCYALFTNIFAISGHYVAGNITKDVLIYYAYSLPLVGCSLWLGNLIHRVIPGEQYAIYVKGLLLILGSYLLYSSIK